MANTLIVYGLPPQPPATDSAGRPVMRFNLSGANQDSFERALRSALVDFVRTDARLSDAALVRISNLTELDAAIRRHQPQQLIYYGHATWKVLSPTRERQPVLNPVGQVFLTAAQVAAVLANQPQVRHFDVLGCQSLTFATELKSLVRNVRIGWLAAMRTDRMEITRDGQVLRMVIDSQAVFHF